MNKEKCFHCGDDCDIVPIVFKDKHFCCNGCKTVFEIFESNDLSYYYDLQSAAGATPNEVEGKYNFLDTPEILDKLIEFNEKKHQIVNLYIPHIHCSSCIWVLENLNKLQKAVSSSQVDFPKKMVRIAYNPEELTL
ncbi:MAG: heavy metal translocating P-type ATPase metal-binding domain-containing protein, partial [Cellulophaga fucicola]